MTPPSPPPSVEFTELYQSGFASLVSQICAYLGDAAEAQDVVQEAYLRAWQQWGRISRYDEPLAWLRRVAWNLATSRWRRQAALHRLLRSQRWEHRIMTVGPNHVALVAALRQIPERQRLVIVLHHLAGHSVEDIANDLGTPRGTVLSWLQRGRKRLAVELSAVTEGEDSHA